jgi:sugar lactone lactonase YvrE
LNQPKAIVFDSNDDMYIADYGNNCIRKVSASSNEITTYQTIESPTCVLISAIKVSLVIEITETKYMFISTSSQTSSKIMRKNMENGTEAENWAGGEIGYSGDGSLANLAKFNGISSIAMDITNSYMYVADTNNHAIRKINMFIRNLGSPDEKKFVTTIAGTGVSGYSGDGGNPVLAQLNQPCGVLVDRYNNIYITEKAGEKIRKISGNKIITVAGLGTTIPNDTFMDASDSKLPKVLSVARMGESTYTSTEGGTIYQIES